MKRKILFAILLVLALALSLAACGEETPDTVSVTGVSLDKSTVSIKVDETLKLKAEVSPADATNKAVTWESSDYFVAAVSQSGEVSGVSAGRATITVKTDDGAKIAVCVVTVTEPDDTPVNVPVTGVGISDPTLALAVGDTSVLTAQVMPLNATNKAVTWTSSAPSVASVSDAGLVTALAEGTATVTATTLDGGKTVSCVITVTEAGSPDIGVLVEGVTLNKSEMTLGIGGAEQLVATINPSNATNKTVTWTSSDPAVVSVSESGLVNALSQGTATVTVVTQDGSKVATCIVTVSPTAPAVVPVESIILSTTEFTLSVNMSKQISATVLPENATDKTLSWTSSNPAVATVLQGGGVVTGISAGTAVITAVSSDGTVSATCTVTVTAGTTSTIPVSAVTLDRSTLSLDVGSSERLTATVFPVDATNKSLAFISSDPSVATVSSDGLVSALAAGNTTITVITADGAKTATCSVTVTVPSTVPAPEYLGIYVSPTVPSETAPRLTALPPSSEYISFIQTLYDTDRWTLDQTKPTAASCDLYAMPGDTVYVEVWLNNPAQCTILSLTLSGVKYQVGGALRSYFYEGGKNCVFVEITIPQNTYIEKNFTIDQIQYVEESNAISGNGKDIMLGDKDKTVEIGLPYKVLPTVTYDSDSASIGYNSITLPYTVTDELGVIPHSGAWIRACIVDSVGVQTQKIAENATSVTFDGLDAAKEYAVIFIAYYDLRDGNGPVVIELARYEFMTDDYLKISGTGGYHTYDYEDGGITKQKKGAEISVNIDPQEDASVTKLEIYVYDDLGISELRYTASASELEALNANNTVTIESTSIYNDREHELRLYRNETDYESARVTTPRILIPKFAGSDPIYDRNHSIDYVRGGITDGYGGFESVPEYAEYGSYVNSIWLDNGTGGQENRVYDRGFATSTSAIYELLVVDHEAVALINTSDIYIYTAFMKNNFYHEEQARYEYNTDVRKVYYAGLDEDGKIGQQVPIDDTGAYEEAEATRPLHRYYIVDTGYIDYEALDYLYYPLTYAEISYDLNDGSEPVLCKYGVELPRRDAWDSGDYSYLYQTDQNPDGTLADFEITTDGTEITMKYNAQRFPEKLYLEVFNSIVLSDGRHLSVESLQGGCTWKDDDHEAKLPIANTSEVKFHIDGSTERVDLDEATKNDPALAKFSARGFTCVRVGKEGNELGSTRIYLSEPIYEFSDEKIAELYGREARLEAEWLDAYMDQILNGGGAQVEKVPIPEFIVWEEIKFNIDDSDYPCGFYAIVGLMPQTEMYFSDAQPEYFAQFDIHDPSVDIAYIEDIPVGTISAPLFEIKGSEPVTVPTNIRMENGELKFDGTTDATVIDITLTFVRNGEQMTVTSSTATYDHTPIPDIKEYVEPIIHLLVAENNISEYDISIELVFRAKMLGDIEYKAPVKVESFKYTSK